MKILELKIGETLSLKATGLERMFAYNQFADAHSEGSILVLTFEQNKKTYTMRLEADDAERAAAWAAEISERVKAAPPRETP